jgi:hypothetical protein
VGSEELATGAVTTGKILDGTITDADISSTAAINGSKLANDSVTATQIALGAVGSEELAAGAVTADKIADSSVAASKISGHGRITITGEKLEVPHPWGYPAMDLGTVPAGYVLKIHALGSIWNPVADKRIEVQDYGGSVLARTDNVYREYVPAVSISAGTGVRIYYNNLTGATDNIIGYVVLSFEPTP